MRTDQLFLDSQRKAGDWEADVLVQKLLDSNGREDLYNSLRLSDDDIIDDQTPGPTQVFLASRKAQPEWFDEKTLRDGQTIFAKYAVEVMTLLGAMALPYCYAASPGNKALYLSEKMRQSPGKRLTETAEFIINVSTPGNLENGKHGHIHINRTRLIHAIARYHVRKRGWSEEWGIPINQEDMAGTNLAFSCVILFGLQRSGFILSEKEKDSFIFLWRYIGYQLGIHESLLPASFREACWMVEIIKHRNFTKSEEGISLTKELLIHYRSILPPVAAKFLAAQIRYLLGHDIASCIGLDRDLFKDGVTSVINSFRELRNLFSVQRSSYLSMMANHQALREKFSR